MSPGVVIAAALALSPVALVALPWVGAMIKAILT